MLIDEVSAPEVLVSFMSDFCCRRIWLVRTKRRKAGMSRLMDSVSFCFYFETIVAVSKFILNRGVRSSLSSLLRRRLRLAGLRPIELQTLSE